MGTILEFRKIQKQTSTQNFHRQAFIYHLYHLSQPAIMWVECTYSVHCKATVYIYIHTYVSNNRGRIPASVLSHIYPVAYQISDSVEDYKIKCFDTYAQIKIHAILAVFLKCIHYDVSVFHMDVQLCMYLHASI